MHLATYHLTIQSARGKLTRFPSRRHLSSDAGRSFPADPLRVPLPSCAPPRRYGLPRPTLLMPTPGDTGRCRAASRTSPYKSRDSHSPFPRRDCALPSEREGATTGICPAFPLEEPRNTKSCKTEIYLYTSKD